MDFLNGLTERLHGPMNFRFLLQPLMASFFAFRDGRKDAKAGKPPYFWALFKHTDQRRELIRDGWKSIGKVFIVAVVLDVVFQLVVFREVRLRGGALWAGVILALLPYLFLRGPINRLVRGKGSGPNDMSETQVKSSAA